jgi:hypothetical protein
MFKRCSRQPEEKGNHSKLLVQSSPPVTAPVPQSPLAWSATSLPDPCSSHPLDHFNTHAFPSWLPLFSSTASQRRSSFFLILFSLRASVLHRRCERISFAPAVLQLLSLRITEGSRFTETWTWGSPSQPGPSPKSPARVKAPLGAASLT